MNIRELCWQFPDMPRWSVTFLVLAVALAAARGAPKEGHFKKPLERPRYIGCVDSSECGVGNCCVIGRGRYSIPTCQSVQEPHGPCRPYGHDLFNTTVSYPDGATVKLTNMYSLFCPCAPGLSCEDETSTCQDPITDPNYIYNTIIV